MMKDDVLALMGEFQWEVWVLVMNVNAEIYSNIFLCCPQEIRLWATLSSSYR